MNSRRAVRSAVRWEMRPSASASACALLFATLSLLVVVDAKAEDAAPTSSQATEAAALVHDRASPIVFRVPRGNASPRQRADDAGAALTAALQEPVDGAPIARVEVDGDGNGAGGIAVVTVLGRSVATLTTEDAQAVGQNIDRYAAELESRLITFVEEERQRTSLQALALKVSLTVLFAVLGLLTFRAVRTLLSRWESGLEESAPAPLALMGVVLLSTDARKALTAVALMVLRAAAYGGIVLLVVAAQLGQFETTRPWLARGARAALEPFARGLDALLNALPGIALAVILLALLRAALEFLRLVLEGVSQGRITSRLVQPNRALPTRIVITVAAALLASPLIIASAFGRFGTPLELLTLVAGGCALLATVPALASATIGVVGLWRQNIKPGDWIGVGDVEGEVASVGVLDFVVVPHNGGSISVPMLSLVMKPVRRIPVPRLSVPLRIKRTKPVASLLEPLIAAAESVDKGASVSLVTVHASWLECEILLPIGKPGARDNVLRAVLDRVDSGALELCD